MTKTGDETYLNDQLKCRINGQLVIGSNDH